MGNRHPISLSNFVYLIIVKVLANKLREVIGDLVGPFQSAFISGKAVGGLHISSFGDSSSIEEKLGGFHER